MVDKKNDSSKLSKQICFPLYAASRELIKRYRPFLDPIGITYTQYITLLVLWDKKKVSVKDLGESLCLDSGTLTPVLKNLESKGYVTRRRSTEDERVLVVTLTEEGEAMHDKVKSIPSQIAKTVSLDAEELKTLTALLEKILIENEQ